MSIVFFTLALALADAGLLRAQEEKALGNFSGIGVRAMGMGGAYAGVADDFTAVFWNPAGLVQIEKREIYAAFLRNNYDSDATVENPGSVGEVVKASSDLSNTRFGSLGVVYPLPVYRGSLVLAAGFNRLRNFDSTVRIKGFDLVDSLAQDNKFTHEGDILVTTLAGASDISPSLSVGVALNFSTGDDENTRLFDMRDTEDIYFQKTLHSREVFEDDYKTTFSAALGLMLRSPREDPKVRLGATISTGPTHKISYTFKGLPPDPEAGPRFNVVELDDGTVERVPNEELKDSYKLSLPFEFGLGLSYKPIQSLLLAGSVHFAEYSQSEYKSRDDKLGLRATADFNDQYKDITRLHLGAEWQVPNVALDLRAGFYTDPLPFVGPRDGSLPASESNPIISIEQDRRFFTLGAGLLLEEVMTLNLAWARGTFEQTEGTLNEDNTITRFFFGLSYDF